MKRLIAEKHAPFLVITFAGMSGILIALMAAYFYFIGVSEFVTARTEARIGFLLSLAALQFCALPSLVFFAVSTLPKTMNRSTCELEETVTTTTTLPLNGLTFDDIRPRYIDDNIGQKFLDWLVRMLRHSKLPVNRHNAVIHIVNEGALVVSPRAFKDFVAFYDLQKRENGSAIMADEAAKYVQRKVEKLHQNIKNRAGMSVHTYTIAGPNRSSRVSGFLFDPIKLFGHVTPPPPNPLLKQELMREFN